MVEMSSNINTEMSSSYVPKNVIINIQSDEKSTFERAIIEAFKQKTSKQINEKLSIALDEIKFTIGDVKSSCGEKFLLNKNIVDKLSRIIERKFFNVNILIAKIFESLLDISNFPILSNDVDLLINFSNEMLNLLDKIRTTIVSRQLEKKCSSFLSYLLENSNLNDEQKSTLKDLLNSFPTRDSSDMYKSFVSQRKDNIIRLCRSQNVKDKLEGINILMDSYGRTASLEEQFDLLLEHCQHIVKAIIHQPNPEYKDVYFHLGNFICSMIFAIKFKIDAFIPEYKFNENEIKKNYFYLIMNDQVINENLKGNVSFLHNSIYELTTQKDILTKCENIFTILNPIIHTLSIYESVFDLQIVCYIILKRIYLTFPKFRKSIEDTLAMTLVNLCVFKEKSELENTEECRQFLHYLLQNGEEDFKSKLRRRIESKGVGASIEPDMPLDNDCDAEYENLSFADFNLRIGYPSSYEIEPGTQMDKYIEIHYPNSLVYIGFATQSNDITSHLLKYIPEDEIHIHNTQESKQAVDDNGDDFTDNGHFVEILKLDKIEASLTPVKIVLFVREPGTYKFIFDNTYSWMTGKSLRYRISVLKPLSEIDMNRRVDFGNISKNLTESSSLRVTTPIISTNSAENKMNIPQSINPHANKILMLKFDGKNRGFSIGTIFQKWQKMRSNSLFLTIPVILTSQSIRVVIRPVTLEHGETKIEFHELFQQNESGNNLQEVFETKMSEYIKSLNYITGKHTIFLNTFFIEKSISPHADSTTNLSITNDEFYKYVYDKLGFYPENLIKTFQPCLKFFALNLADSCLLYVLYKKVIEEEHFNSIIHIHFDKYRAQASLFSEGIIHDKISGLNYYNEKPLTDNLGNVMDFINRVSALFGEFDLSISFSDIDSK